MQFQSELNQRSKPMRARLIKLYSHYHWFFTLLIFLSVLAFSLFIWRQTVYQTELSQEKKIDYQKRKAQEQALRGDLDVFSEILKEKYQAFNEGKDYSRQRDLFVNTENDLSKTKETSINNVIKNVQ